MVHVCMCVCVCVLIYIYVYDVCMYVRLCTRYDERADETFEIVRYILRDQLHVPYRTRLLRHSVGFYKTLRIRRPLGTYTYICTRFLTYTSSFVRDVYHVTFYHCRAQTLFISGVATHFSQNSFSILKIADLIR